MVGGRVVARVVADAVAAAGRGAAADRRRLGAGDAGARPAGDRRRAARGGADGRTGGWRCCASGRAIICATMLAENGGVDGELPLLRRSARRRGAAATCAWSSVDAGGRRWRVLATRSGYPVPAGELVAACRRGGHRRQRAVAAARLRAALAEAGSAGAGADRRGGDRAGRAYVGGRCAGPATATRGAMPDRARRTPVSEQRRARRLAGKSRPSTPADAGAQAHYATGPAAGAPATSSSRQRRARPALSDTAAAAPPACPERGPARRVALRVVGAVGRVEPDHRAFAAEIFERRLALVDQRDDDLAVARASWCGGSAHSRRRGCPPRPSNRPATSSA